jgi:uncharacterized protein (TIGR04255 family)
MKMKIAYPNLQKAPIEEAIISITIDREKHSSLQAIEEICSNFVAHPRRNIIRMNEVVVEHTDDSFSASQKNKDSGFALSTEDNKEILQVSVDTLSLHRLNPYISWENLEKSYKEAWEIYTSSLSIEKIKDLAIRYINSFPIPTENWSQNILMHPNIATENEVDSSKMFLVDTFSRHILTSEKYAAEATVLLHIKHESQNSLRVIMDIGVRSRTGISNFPKYDAITETFNRLRNFKNQIFFSNVPKAAELFS